MAEDKIEGRELTWRQLLPWTELFRGFQVAFDLNKMLLAAAGIVVMALGWWLLALTFATGFKVQPPDMGGQYSTTYPDEGERWKQVRRDRNEWNLMYETAGIGESGQKYQVLDLAGSFEEYQAAEGLDKPGANVPQAVAALVREGKLSEAQGRVYLDKLGKPKPYARLNTFPLSEPRGPNPYLLVTGQAGIPWEAGRFWDWFLRDQLPVMIEPLVKFVQPIVYFFSPRSTGWTSAYFFFVMLWTLAAWAFFGGAITRIAAVQITRGEKIGLRESVRFAAKRIVSYLMAPLFPVGFLLVVLFFMILFGIPHLIPWFGDIVWDGLLWWLLLICGLVMAATLVGLVGWPLMSATISTEGTDAWEAVSRSYSYVYQKPWHYVWYSLVAVAYGAVLLFFVGFMASLMVYLAKWGLSKNPLVSMANREPAYLFVYAPTSFGWRTLLLEGATVGELHWWNTVGAFLVSVWLSIVFLLMLGFGYSYFWSASTIVYLLMRRHVDAAELDEVYLEEDEQEGPYGGSFVPPAPPPAPAVKPPEPMTMVEPPTLRTPPPEPSPSPEPPPAASQEGEGGNP